MRIHVFKNHQDKGRYNNQTRQYKQTAEHVFLNLVKKISSTLISSEAEAFSSRILVYSKLNIFSIDLSSRLVL